MEASFEAVDAVEAAGGIYRAVVGPEGPRDGRGRPNASVGAEYCGACSNAGGGDRD